MSMIEKAWKYIFIYLIITSIITFMTIGFLIHIAYLFISKF